MKPAIPPSETHLGTNLLGFFSALAAIYLLRDSGLSHLDMALAVLSISVFPILLIEGLIFKRHREERAKLQADRPVDLDRVFIKCLGLIGVLLSFMALYYLLPEYDKPFYQNVWPFYMALAPFVVLGAPFYFAWCDARQDDPQDGYYHLGNLMLLQTKGTDWKSLKRLYRNWLVKAFFLPLMFTYSSDSIRGLAQTHWDRIDSFLALYFALYAVIMFADLLYATLGYIFTMRIFNAHIRSSEPTFFGWFVTVICYYPFWAMLFYSSYFAYDDNVNWQEILPQGIWQYLWGSVVVLSLVIYALSTVCLGIRFSNLTYRGLVTNGPYRFSKHPGYVGKNISWWLVSLPFISSAGTEVALAHTFGLIGVNVLYYFRARTEENHLSNYPEYVEYALAMNERSIFAPLAKRLPFLLYKKPENPPAI